MGFIYWFFFGGGAKGFALPSILVTFNGGAAPCVLYLSLYSLCLECCFQSSSMLWTFQPRLKINIIDFPGTLSWAMVLIEFIDSQASDVIEINSNHSDYLHTWTCLSNNYSEIISSALLIPFKDNVLSWRLRVSRTVTVNLRAKPNVRFHKKEIPFSLFVPCQLENFNMVIIDVARYKLKK